MKRVRPEVWVCQLQPPRNPRLPQRRALSHDTRPLSSQPFTHRNPPQNQWQYRTQPVGRRFASAAAVAEEDESEVVELPPKPRRKQPERVQTHRNNRIAKLSALHARLTLPPSLPLNSLARCLIHESADSHPGRNNKSLAVLGRDLLAYHTTEHLMVNYPRLPLSILQSAQYGYSGPATLSAMRAEWGVEVAAAPGIEVDRALLQFVRVIPGNALAADGQSRVKDHKPKPQSDQTSDDDEPLVKVGSKIGSYDEFGDHNMPLELPEQEEPEKGVTVEEAGASFIRALVGAIYLHAGDQAVKTFHQEHVLSRHLELHKLFNFQTPTRDLNRLCYREDFDQPVARLISETGRRSRSPVFVVGIFSGEDKLGEGAGASLDEGRVRAAAAAMRSWYLYSPPADSIMRPSEMQKPQDGRKQKQWQPQMIDIGEIIS